MTNYQPQNHEQNAQPEVAGPIRRRLHVIGVGPDLIARAKESLLPEPDEAMHFQPSHPAGRAITEQVVEVKPRITNEVARTIFDEAEYPAFVSPTDEQVAFPHLDGLSGAKSDKDTTTGQVVDLEQFRLAQEAREHLEEYYGHLKESA